MHHGAVKPACLLVFASYLLSAAASSVIAPAAASLCSPVFPVPTGCAVRGHVGILRQNYPTYTQPQIVKSVEECATVCANRMVNETLYQTNQRCEEGYYEFCDYCQSFEYTVKTGLCQPWSIDLTKFVRKDPNGPAIISKAGGCYTCPPSGCEAPLNINLLDNSGFEGELFGPWITNYGSFGRGINSSTAWQCRPSYPSYYADNGDGCYLAQTANTCPGGLYLISLDYKLPANKTDREFALDCGENYTPGGRTFKRFKAGPRQSTSWESFASFCRIPPGKKNPFFGGPFEFSFTNLQRYLIDNVKMVRALTNPSPKSGSQTLFANGGFEDGTFEPWKLGNENRWKIITPGINSTYAAKLTHVRSSISQTVTTRVGTAYLLDLDLSFVGPQSIDIVFGPKNDSLDFTIDQNLGYNGTHSFPYMAQHPETTVKITIYEGVVIDNISFKEAKIF